MGPDSFRVSIRHHYVLRIERAWVPVALAMLLGDALPAAAQVDSAPARKQAHAARLAGEIRLDGRLDDEPWLAANPITDFVQREPVEGGTPADRIEIRFLYDAGALYVGARMFVTDLSTLDAPMSRRDDSGQADALQIELDTYLDRRTSYMFGVTASGVRLDHYHAQDSEGVSDARFDPVWEARTAIDDRGWTAELRLPFSQLRFNDRSEQVFGLNIKWARPALNEENYWIPIGKTERGWASRFGELRGIDDVRKSHRVELLPYVAGSSRVTGDRDLANPFDDGKNLDQRIGLDAKVGLGSNLTFEGTINPDFGQVEADPAEVNLSAVETTFSERRPFFQEGGALLQGPVNNFFYSRRIGAPPTGPASGDYVDYPAAASIIGAAKLTGRLPSGTAVGALGAVTNEAFARIATAGVTDRTKVAPRTLWSVARVEQEFGSQRTVGLQLTAVHRDLGAGDPLSELLVRNAFGVLGDTALRFRDSAYEAEFSYGFAYIEGDPAAIARLQRGNAHLFQRPDVKKVRLDTTRTSLGGAHVRASFDKVAGRHWLWGGNTMFETPEFEPRDLGRLNYAGDAMTNTHVTYRETRPGRLFRSYSISLNPNFYHQVMDRELDPRESLGLSTSWTFLNFWNVGANITRTFRGQDPQQTRGGPAIGTPRRVNTRISLRNSNSAQTRWSAAVSYDTSEFGDRTFGPDASFSMRPSPSWQFSIEPSYTAETNTRQYVTTRSDGRPESYGNRYIFGSIDRTTLSMQARVSYTFKPDLTLDVYAEPFAASGRYDRFGEVPSARSFDLRAYGENGITQERQPDGSRIVTDGDTSFTLSNRDFNVRSFRSNVVLRWEWRPGSTLFVVWQQNRASSIATGAHVGVGDLFESLTARGDNIFAIKTTVWLSR